MIWSRQVLVRAPLIMLVLGLLAGSGCNSKGPTSKLVFLEDPAITSSGSPSAGPARVDVCLEATPSMAGFAADPKSVYLTLLDDLEGVVQNEMRDSEVRYFAFSESVHQISRMDFRKARDQDFYHEPGTWKRTNLELVFLREYSAIPVGRVAEGSTLTGADRKRAEQAEPPTSAGVAVGERTAIVVTDLLEDAQDVNQFVSEVRRNCLESGCSVGILPVMSEFRGTVYDGGVHAFPFTSTPGDPKTWRPFYLLFFGNQDRIEELVRLLSTRAYITKDRFLLVSPKMVRRYAVALRKDKASKDLNLRGASSAPDEFEFALRKGANGGSLLGEIQYEPIPGCPRLDPTKVRMVALSGRKGQVGRPCADVQLISATSAGGAISVQMSLQVPGKPGEYDYQLLFCAGGIDSMAPPSWVAELSSDNPTTGKDSEKTLNLARLVEELIGANVAVHPPPIARVFLTVKKLG